MNAYFDNVSKYFLPKVVSSFPVGWEDWMENNPQSELAIEVMYLGAALSPSDQHRFERELKMAMGGKAQAVPPPPPQQAQAAPAQAVPPPPPQQAQAAPAQAVPPPPPQQVKPAEAEKGPGFMAAVREKAGNALGGVKDFASRPIFGGIPLWIVVVGALLLFNSGILNGLGDLLPKGSSGGTSTGLTGSPSVWIKTAAGVTVPINKMPFPKIPFADMEMRKLIAALLLLVNPILVAFDNAAARPNQEPNHKSNIGFVLYFVAAMLWGYWAVIIAGFSLFLTLRSREGNTSSIGNQFFLLILGLWIWFSKLAPIVNGYLDGLHNPMISWLPTLLRYLFNGENLRPLAAIALVGFLIYSVLSDMYDSSTLITLMGFQLAWFLGTGVFLFWEKMPMLYQMPFFYFQFALVVIAIFIEQKQVGLLNLPKGILILFGVMYFVSLGIRDYFDIDPNGTTVWRYMTQPVIFLYMIVLWLSYAFGKAVSGGSKVFAGLYQTLGSWFGQLVPIAGLQVPSDGLITLNLVLAGVLVFTQVILY
ncbi:MAG: hypothetical protein HYV39_02985 [Candidatus Levybacteria bacterium]|nr:hypothetical protein [Candidatus Levybacteria bacterium]